MYSTQATHTRPQHYAISVSSLQDFEGRALFSPGSKQPQKTNNYIQQIVYMHQTPHTKSISLLAIELINISAAQPLIVHAGHERANEAKLQRQCAHQSRLSTKGQNHPSDLPDQSRSAQDEMLLKRATRDLPLGDSL